jgi:hypothetical protein
MNEVAVWDGQRDVVDGWAVILADVAELSRVIAGTEFVPKDLKDRPAAVGAAILAGRELGIGPMTSLRQLHVINGAPTMSALLMRALVQSHGHRIRVIESTSTRCVMAGRRSDDDANEEPTRVTYSIDDAKQAGILANDNWRKRPRAMLLARATGELCRSTFADVIVGIPYTSEELASEGPDQLDGQADGEPAAEPDAPPRRIVARKTAVRKPPQAAPAPGPAPDDGAPAEPDAAPQEAVQAPAQPEPAAPPTSADVYETAIERLADPDTTPASRDQQRLVFKLLGDLGAAEPRARRIEVVQALIARRVQSLTQITVREASVLIDTLTRVQDQRSPESARQYLAWLVGSGLDHLRLTETGDSGEQPTADVQPITRPGAADDAPAEPGDPGFDDPQ